MNQLEVQGFLSHRKYEATQVHRTELLVLRSTVLISTGAIAGEVNSLLSALRLPYYRQTSNFEADLILCLLRCIHLLHCPSFLLIVGPPLCRRTVRLMVSFASVFIVNSCSYEKTQPCTGLILPFMNKVRRNKALHSSKSDTPL